MLSPAGAKPADVALSIVGGDGTVTAVDVKASPPRLYGGVQSFGTDDDEEEEGRSWSPDEEEDDDDDEADEEDDKDDDKEEEEEEEEVVVVDNVNDKKARRAKGRAARSSGLRFVQGDMIVDIPVPTYFESRQMPFFVQPFTLNAVEPTKVLLWANSTTNGKQPAGVYEFDVPYNVTDGTQIGPPSLVATTPEDCYLIHAGGLVDGKEEPSLLVAMSATTLYVRTGGAAAAGRSAPLEARPLPVAFAKPITKLYDARGHKIESPTSHGKTVSLAVAASDARVLAVTGWASVRTNVGVNESLWLSNDLGTTWTNVIGNLAEATATVGLARPLGLAFVDLPAARSPAGPAGSSAALKRALVVGTVNGIFVSRAEGATAGQWRRLGRCTELPLVLAYGLEYEPSSDTLVAATLGRGVYTLANAKAEIAKALL